MADLILPLVSHGENKHKSVWLLIAWQPGSRERERERQRYTHTQRRVWDKI
jgi:hypothetical protein